MLGNQQDFIAFAAARGLTVEPDEALVALQKATDYLNVLCWKGELLQPDQLDCFPRINIPGYPLKDADGNTITEQLPGDAPLPDLPKPIPTKALECLYRLGMTSAEGVDLMPITEGGKQVLEERVEGAVTVRYDAGTIGAGVSLPFVDQLLEKLLECSTTSGLGNFNVYAG